jgi:hypothetical protein
MESGYQFTARPRALDAWVKPSGDAGVKPHSPHRMLVGVGEPNLEHANSEKDGGSRPIDSNHHATPGAVPRRPRYDICERSAEGMTCTVVPTP